MNRIRNLLKYAVLLVFIVQQQLMATESVNLKTRFNQLAQEWSRHCQSVAFSSNMKSYLNHDSYRQLVALGKPAVPAIMQRYAVDDLPWGFVLQDITGVKIIEDRNNFSPADVRKRWLRWCAEHETALPKSGLAAEQIGHLALSPKAKANHAVYHLTLPKPILEMPYGNMHVSDMHAGQDTLNVAMAWDSKPGQYTFACVPWSDIRTNSVKYGLPEFYDPTGLPGQYQQNPLAELKSDLPFDPASLGIAHALGTKRTRDGKYFVFTKRSVYKVESPRKILWELRLPDSHSAIAFDVTDQVLFIALNSNQGFRDGELAMPMQTTQVFAVSLKD